MAKKTESRIIPSEIVSRLHAGELVYAVIQVTASHTRHLTWASISLPLNKDNNRTYSHLAAVRIPGANFWKSQAQHLTFSMSSVDVSYYYCIHYYYFVCAMHGRLSNKD